jgi:hypothetical protein
MKRFFFFFHELRFDAVTVGVHSWVVIVDISTRNLRCWRREVTLKGNTFGAYAKSAWVVWDRVVRGERAPRGLNHGGEIV